MSRVRGSLIATMDVRRGGKTG